MAIPNKSKNGQSYTKDIAKDTALQIGNGSMVKVNKGNSILPDQRSNLSSDQVSQFSDQVLPSQDLQKSCIRPNLGTRDQEEGQDLETRGQADGQEQPQTFREEETVQMLLNLQNFLEQLSDLERFVIKIIHIAFYQGLQEMLKRQSQQLQQENRNHQQRVQEEQQWVQEENKKQLQHITLENRKHQQRVQEENQKQLDLIKQENRNLRQWIERVIKRMQLENQDHLEQQLRQLRHELGGDLRLEMKENQNTNEPITAKSFALEPHWTQQHGVNTDYSDEEEGSDERKEVFGAEADVPSIQAEKYRVSSSHRFDGHDKDFDTDHLIEISEHSGQNRRVSAKVSVLNSLSYSNNQRGKSNGSTGNKQSAKRLKFIQSESSASRSGKEYPSDSLESEGDSKKEKAQNDENENHHRNIVSSDRPYLEIGIDAHVYTEESNRVGRNGIISEVVTTSVTGIVSDSNVPPGEYDVRTKEKTHQHSIELKSVACGGNPGDPSDGSDSEVDSKKDRSKVNRDDNGQDRDGDGKRNRFDWRIDIDSWKMCIEDGDEIRAEQLLSEKILPDDKLLQQANLKFGRTSKTVSDICKRISEFISKESEEIVDVWAAYEYKNNCDNDAGAQAEILFVVCTTQKIDKINITTYKTFQRSITETHKTENQIIREREQEIRADDEEMKQITQCMKDNSVTLMNNHSNITRISVSWVKSKGYGTAFSSMYQDLCLVLYVHIKGLIPIGEDPFPTNIGIYSVDVREGVFLPLASPFEHHEQIKMGCAIRGGMEVGGGVGTLGGFVEHNDETYCITSAHVMFGGHYFKSLEEIKFISFGPQDLYWAYQPITESAKPFGKIVKAVYREGGSGVAGVEAVLIRMHERLPSSGNFPDATNYREGGFDNVMSYTSGKTLEMTALRRRTEVIKYGIYSHVTRGSFRLDGASIRCKNAQGMIRSLGFLLHNQIEVEAIGNVPFAMRGDSGALVMTEENGDLIAIGILEGEMDGTYIVTPICDVLEALGIPRNHSLKQFRPLTVATNRPSENSQQTPATHPNTTPDSGISITEQISPDHNAFLNLVSKVTKISERFASVEQDLPQDVAKHAAENKKEIDEKLKAMETHLQQQSVEHRQQNTEIKDQITEKITAVKRQLQQQSVEHRQQNAEIKDQMTENATAVERQLQQQSVEHRQQNTEIKDQMTEKIIAMERQLQQQSVEHRQENAEIKDQMTEKINAVERQLQKQSEEHKKQTTEMTERIDAVGRQLERKSEEQNQDIKNQMTTITQLLLEMKVQNQKKE